MLDKKAYLENVNLQYPMSVKAVQKKICFVLLWSGLYLLSACKKDKETSPDIAGNWIGQYGIGTNSTGVGYKFFINENGEFGVSQDTTSTTPSAVGTWHLSGNSFRATYVYNNYGLTYTAEGTLSNNRISGTWGEGVQTTAGKFSVTKK